MNFTRFSLLEGGAIQRATLVLFARVDFATLESEEDENIDEA